MAAALIGGIYLIASRRKVSSGALPPTEDAQLHNTVGIAPHNQARWHGNQHTQDNLETVGRYQDMPTGFKKFNAANNPYIAPLSAPYNKGEVPLEHSEVINHVEVQLQ